MSFDLVTVGVACADVVVRPVETFPDRGKLALVPHLKIHLGGLAGVTATTYCRLGGRAAFIGRVGQDGFGDFIVNALTSQGVNVDHVRRAPDLGTSATIVLVSADGERTLLHQVGATASISEDDVDIEFVRQAKVLHWGGPLVTPGLDGEPIGRVFRRARDAGVQTSIDTCFDGNGIWFPLIEHALPHADIVMSSIQEARHYTGRQTPEAIADFYRSCGVDTVLIKLGGDGLYAKNAQEAHRVAAHDVPVRDTTGAGDAACGGFLYGYVRGWDLLRCARLANAVGGLTVQSMGGAEAIESLEATLSFMDRA